MAVASPDVLLSLFADDSAIYTSGRGIKRMIKTIQKTLNKIERWCQTWGFKLSAAKTTCVVFSKRKKFNSCQPKLTVNKQEIVVKTEARFLGLHFDSKLTWKNHIEYITTKCNKRLNLLRNLRGTSWGATMKTLLTVYKDLIRSVIEYADAVYDSATTTIKKKLDNIQYQALLICTSAMKGTSLIALQNECGEMPLQIMREKHQLIIAAKTKSVENHRLTTIIEAPEQVKTRHVKKLQLISSVTEPIFKDQNWKVQYTIQDNKPPWIQQRIIRCVNTNHKTAIDKHQQANRIIDKYSNHLHIYTDGAVDLHGRSAAGFYIPALNKLVTKRITNSSVYTTELIGVNMAIEWATQQLHYSNIIIFTDSVEAIQNINRNSLSVNNMQTNIIAAIQQNVDKAKLVNMSLEWILGHANIPAHDLIDTKTKEALGRNAIDMEIPSSLHEIITRIDKYSINKWQNYYNSHLHAKWYKSFEPTISNKPKTVQSTRNNQRKISRLKLGRCSLNYYQHQNKFHADGLCQFCGVPETIEHHVMICKQYNYIAKLQDILTKTQLQPTLHNILTNTELAENLCKHITRTI